MAESNAAVVPAAGEALMATKVLDLDALDNSLRHMEARLEVAYLNEELDKPPLIRVEMALWARKHGPQLLAAARERDALRGQLAASRSVTEGHVLEFGKAFNDCALDLKTARDELVLLRGQLARVQALRSDWEQCAAKPIWAEGYAEGACDGYSECLLALTAALAGEQP